MTYSEFAINKLFKVVKITDHDGISKECNVAQSRIYNKVVKVVNLFEDASVMFVPVDYLGNNLLPVNDCKAVSTSLVESISLSTTMGLPARLVVETLNTVYYLDEYLPTNLKGE